MFKQSKTPGIMRDDGDGDLAKQLRGPKFRHLDASPKQLQQQTAVLQALSAPAKIPQITELARSISLKRPAEG